MGAGETACGATGMTDAAPDGVVVNEVRLLGRLAADPRRVDLPSGDTLVQLRLVVPRPPDPMARAEGRRPPTVDTFDVSCWPGPVGEVAALLAADDVVEVRGALRRRFYRTPGGVQSRHEVHAQDVEVLRMGGDDSSRQSEAESGPADAPAGESS